MNVSLDNINKVYSGKPGCMCGCKGTYNDSDIAKKRMWNRFQKEQEDWKIDIDAGCVYNTTETRNNVIYFAQDS